MEIENYVMENFIKKIMKNDIRAHSYYVLEEDLNALKLNSEEENFIMSILKKHDIAYYPSVERLKRKATARERLEKDVRKVQERMKTDPKFRREISSDIREENNQQFTKQYRRPF